MAKVYKQGDWAKHGRVMPWQRTKAKVIDQILEDGTITQTNCDQVFKPSEVKSLLLKYFSDGIEKNGRIYLNSLVEKDSLFASTHETFTIWAAIGVRRRSAYRLKTISRNSIEITSSRELRQFFLAFTTIILIARMV